MLELKIVYDKKDNNSSGYKMSMLRQIFSALEDLVENVVLKFTEQHIKAQVIDSMHVCLCDISINSNLFSSYKCDNELNITLPLKTFNAIFKNMNVATEDSELKIFIDKTISKTASENSSNATVDTANTLTIVNKNSMCQFKNTIALLDSNSPEFILPQDEFANEIEITTEGFLLMKSMGGLFGTKVLFQISQDKFIIKSGSDGTESLLCFKANDNKAVTINSTNPTEVEISKNYLDIIQKIFTLSSKMKINISQGSPVLFELSLHEYGYVNFFIAPQA